MNHQTKEDIVCAVLFGLMCIAPVSLGILQIIYAFTKG